jgi:hypothetical protein
MPTGATGVRGLQGIQGGYGPRGPTGILGWNQQVVINKYGNNPTGPTGPLGNITTEMTSVTLTNSSLSIGSGGYQYFNLSSPGYLHILAFSSPYYNVFIDTGPLSGSPVGSIWYFKCADGYSGSRIYVGTQAPSGGTNFTVGSPGTGSSQAADPTNGTNGASAVLIKITSSTYFAHSYMSTYPPL